MRILGRHPAIPKFAIPLEPQNGHRIGITNAIQRLNLLYGQGEAVITFSNLPSGGACVTILLPAI